MNNARTAIGWIVGALFIVGAIAFNAFPYWYAAQHAPRDATLIGSYPIIFDKPTYLAEMRQGYEGSWHIINRFTHEPQSPVFLYSFYTALGHSARITGLSPDTVFFASRFFFGAILLLMIVLAIRCFLSTCAHRLFALGIVLFGSGLSWIPGAPQRSLDMWIPDFVPMVRFSYFPHFSAATALLLGIILLIERFITRRSLYAVLGAGICAALLAIVLPFHTLLLFPLILLRTGIHVASQRHSVPFILRGLTLFFLCALPAFLFQLSIGLFNPFWRAIQEANLLPMPTAIATFFGMGLVLIFFIIGSLPLIKQKGGAGIFIVLWVWLALLFSYIIPIPIHRRFIEAGLYVPLAIGAGVGLTFFLRHLFPARITALNPLRVVFSLVLIVLVGIGLGAGNERNVSAFKERIANGIAAPDFFVPNDLISGLERLTEHTEPDDIVFSSFLVGNLIPAYANRTVYIGHVPFTLWWQRKLDESVTFFQRRMDPHEAHELFLSIPVSTVIESYNERSEHRAPLEDSYPFLEPIFANNALTIYHVQERYEESD